MLGRIEDAFREKSSSEQRLRQFVADASHELRTPLTSIRGYTELLRKGAFTDDDSQDKALQRVEREAGRMGLLVSTTCSSGAARPGPAARGDARWTSPRWPPTRSATLAPSSRTAPSISWRAAR